MGQHYRGREGQSEAKEAGGGGGGGGGEEREREVEIQYQCSKTISKENHMWKESDQVRSFTPQIIP